MTSVSYILHSHHHRVYDALFNIIQREPITNCSLHIPTFGLKLHSCFILSQFLSQYKLHERRCSSLFLHRESNRLFFWFITLIMFSFLPLRVCFVAILYKQFSFLRLPYIISPLLYVCWNTTINFYEKELSNKFIILYVILKWWYTAQATPCSIYDNRE